MLPFVSLLVVVLIGCAGLVVDVRNGYVVHGMLQRAADDGAISALRWFTQVDDTQGGPGADVAGGAVAEAMRVVQQELASQGVAGISAASATLTGGRLTLTARANVPTFFLGLFGVGRWVESAHAEVTIASANPIVPSVVPPQPSGVFEPAVIAASGFAPGGAFAGPLAAGMGLAGMQTSTSDGAAAAGPATNGANGGGAGEGAGSDGGRAVGSEGSFDGGDADPGMGSDGGEGGGGD